MEQEDILMHKVVEQLGIKIGPFRLNAENDSYQDDDNNPIFLRGKDYIKTRKWAYDMNPTDQDEIPYAFDEDEHIVIPDSKTDESLYGYQGFDYYNISRLTEPVDYCNPKNSDIFSEKMCDVPAYKWQIDTLGLIYSNTSKEGIQYANALSGYTDMYNSMIPPLYSSGLPLSGGAAESNYTRPLLGMQEIPLKLNDAFQSIRGKTRMNMELVSVSINKKGRKGARYKLYFAKTRTNRCTGVTTVIEKADLVVIHTDRLILAGIPENVLPGLFTPENHGFKVSQAARSLFQEVRPLHYGKYFFAYDGVLPQLNVTDFEPWTVGRYTSSTALSQIFMWYPGTQASKRAKHCNVTVLQVYSSDPALQSFSQAIGRDFHVDAYEDDSSQEAMGCPTSDSRVIIDGFVGFINKRLALHLNVKVEDLPDMLEVKHMSWTVDNPRSQTSSFHLWKAGVKWWEAFVNSLQPVASEHIHFVGDTFSVQQGWGEGALISAEYMLQEKMKIPAPTWLSKLEYCKTNPFYPEKRNNRED